MSSATVSSPQVAPAPNRSPWSERSARLFEELRRPASAMVRRAFGSAFGDHEVEDIYANAWVGTLRALERRHAELDDEEIRKYVFTAVAHQASKELRRRRRKPTAPLEKAGTVADASALPDERARKREDSLVTRDLLASLPRRRRAVLMLRYGWGLEPSQVCDLIGGLSPRAYRKEITKGVDQLTQKLRTLESGEWCADREPILKAFASGLADAEQERQAQHHLAHCRHCADFVGKLSGHLHDLGSAAAVPGALDVAQDGRLDLPDRVTDLVDRTRDSLSGVVSRGGSVASDSAGSALPGAAPRGAGAAGAGVFAKVAGLGVAGKTAAACFGGGAAAAVCVAAGIGPLDPPRSAPERVIERPAAVRTGPKPRIDVRVLSTPTPEAEPATPVGSDGPGNPPEQEPDAPEPVEAAPPPPPAAQQFDLAPAPAASPAAPASGGSSRDQAAAQEFGP